MEAGRRGGPRASPTSSGHGGRCCKPGAADPPPPTPPVQFSPQRRRRIPARGRRRAGDCRRASRRGGRQWLRRRNGRPGEEEAEGGRCPYHRRSPVATRSYRRGEDERLRSMAVQARSARMKASGATSMWMVLAETTAAARQVTGPQPYERR